MDILSTYGNKPPGMPGAILTGRIGRPAPPSGTSPKLVPSNLGLEVTDELLGEGATGRVWLGKFGPARAAVAAKVVRKSALNAEQLGWIREEIAIHRPLRHPNICTLHGAVEDASSITMVLALCKGGSLCDTMGRALETNAPLGEKRSRAAFCQLLGALHYCHRNGVVHRDIKLVRASPARACPPRAQSSTRCRYDAFARRRSSRASALGSVVGNWPLPTASLPSCVHRTTCVGRAPTSACCS